jgi:hypothetical protein
MRTGNPPSIPPVGPLEVLIRTSAKPARVTLEPGTQILAFTQGAGEIRVAVPRLDIHRVVVVE